MSDQITYAHVVLEWRFTPADFFGDGVRVTREEYAVFLADGRAEAVIKGARFAAKESMRERIHSELVSRFGAVQMLRHQPYELSRPTLVKVRPDGTRDIFIELQGVVCTVTGGTVGVSISDLAGNVVYDSERIRREEGRALGERVARHAANPQLVALLTSYEAAVRDPDNKLAHL